MVKNTIYLGHHMLLSLTSILAMKSRNKDQLIREATWAEFRPNNLNRENKISKQIMETSYPVSEVREGLLPSQG
jgi:hypothetical protein